jgi:pre-mRNA-splicing factor ATP-dependent RNA helicase DHX16
MTWIKPSFLWMAYRSGFGTKPGQEHVLAIEMTRAGFEWALAHACLSHFDKSLYSDEGAWRERVATCPVRVQWDPERDVQMNALGYRSLQMGLSGEAVVRRYTDEWIVGIVDVTAKMQRVAELVEQRKLEEARAEIPVEEDYPLPEELAKVVGATAIADDTN